MYAGGGWILNQLGTRRGYVLMIVWWSSANFLTGFVTSLSGLQVFRFLLGMGEGGGFPASGKAVSEWFPPRERSFAFGLFNTGSSLGAVAAAPLLAFVAHSLGWHWVFYLTGAAGFVWAAAWLLLYERPEKSRHITAEELEHIRRELSPRFRRPPDPLDRSLWLPAGWGLMLAKLLTDSVWFFLLFWLPKYLGDVRGFDIKQIGYYAWIPFVFAGVGSLAGGGLGTLLISSGQNLDRSRKIALASRAPPSCRRRPSWTRPPWRSRSLFTVLPCSDISSGPRTCRRSPLICSLPALWAPSRACSAQPARWALPSWESSSDG